MKVGEQEAVGIHDVLWLRFIHSYRRCDQKNADDLAIVVFFKSQLAVTFMYEKEIDVEHLRLFSPRSSRFHIVFCGNC